MLDIRQIRPDDADRLRRMRLAALSSDPSAFGSTYDAELGRLPAEWAALAEARSAGDPGTNFFAVDAEDQPVGLIGVFREGGGAVLTSMWVAPQSRGLGMAVGLVRAALAWAVSTGWTPVELWVTRDNDPARLLYEKLGFVVTDDVQLLPSDPCREEVRMRWEPLVSPG